MSLFGLFERRSSLENPAIPLTDAGLASILIGPPTDSGIAVDGKTAMKMAAVYRGVALLSNLGGALPIKVYKKGTKQPTESTLLDSPHPDMTPLEFWRLSYIHRILWGNSYAQKIYARGTGEIKSLYPITPNRVTPGQAKPTKANPSGKVFRVIDDTGVAQPMTANEVFHIPGLGFDPVCGVSVIQFAAQGIGLALAAESYGARLFGSGNLMSGVLTTDQKLTQQQAEALQARWQQMNQGLDRSHRTAILDAGAKFQSLTLPNDDAQLLQSRDFEVTEIARFMGIPPYLMFQTEKTTSWGTGLEQQARGFTAFDLDPGWLAPVEQRITKELLPEGVEAAYDMTRLLRGDSAARAEFYKVMVELGVLSPNEVRDAEDLPPREGGDNYRDAPDPIALEEAKAKAAAANGVPLGNGVQPKSNGAPPKGKVPVPANGKPT